MLVVGGWSGCQVDSGWVRSVVDWLVVRQDDRFGGWSDRQDDRLVVDVILWLANG